MEVRLKSVDGGGFSGAECVWMSLFYGGSGCSQDLQDLKPKIKIRLHPFFKNMILSALPQSVRLITS